MATYQHHAATLSIRSVTMCRAAISPVHKVPLNVRNVLVDDGHSMHYRTTQYYKPIMDGNVNREEQGLWIVVGANMLPRKRVVRSWARRRLLRAISEQLGAHGFDTNGRRLKGADAEIIHNKKTIGGLIGLVDMSLTDSIISCKYEEILRQTATLVQEIIARCGVAKNGCK